MKLIADGEEILCDKVVKGMDYIVAYLQNAIIAEFRGIGNFSSYNLFDGEWDEPEVSINERLAIAEKRNAELENAIVELASIVGGE